MASVSRPPSTSRVTLADFWSAASSSLEAKVACGHSSSSATICPTQFESSSIACLPMRRRSGFSVSTSFWMTRATASGSSACSESTRMARSAPMASPVRSCSCAVFAPIETSTTSLPGTFSFTRSASSIAISSKGLITHLTLSPTMLLPSGAILMTVSGSGTRFTATRIFTRGSFWGDEVDYTARHGQVKALGCQSACRRALPVGPAGFVSGADALPACCVWRPCGRGRAGASRPGPVAASLLDEGAQRDEARVDRGPLDAVRLLVARLAEHRLAYAEPGLRGRDASEKLREAAGIALFGRRREELRLERAADGPLDGGVVGADERADEGVGVEGVPSVGKQVGMGALEGGDGRPHRAWLADRLPLGMQPLGDERPELCLVSRQGREQLDAPRGEPRAALEEDRIAAHGGEVGAARVEPAQRASEGRHAGEPKQIGREEARPRGYEEARAEEEHGGEGRTRGRLPAEPSPRDEYERDGPESRAEQHERAEEEDGGRRMAAGKEDRGQACEREQDELEGAQDDRRAHRWALRAQSRHAEQPQQRGRKHHGDGWRRPEEPHHRQP